MEETVRLSTNTRRWLAVGATVLTIGGGGGLALAQGGGATSGPPAAAQTAPDRPEPGDVPDRAGARDDGLAPGTASVQVPGDRGADERSEKAEAPGVEQEEGTEANEAAEGRAEAAEAAKLAPLAKIDRAQAEQAALAKVPGTATGAELGDENGNLVWEIDVTAKDGTQHEVKVDAGNGTVLMAQVDDQR